MTRPSPASLRKNETGRTAREASVEPDGWARHSPLERPARTQTALASEVVPRSLEEIVPEKKRDDSPKGHDGASLMTLRPRQGAHHHPVLSGSRPHGGRAGVPALPEIEERVRRYWDADDTFQASVDATRRARRLQRVRVLRRPAVRQRAAALRAPADRLRQGRRAAVPDDARPPGRAPVRLGLPRPAGRGRGREAAGDQDQGRDPGARHREVQPGAGVRAAVHPEWQEYVTSQARWVDFDHDYKTLELPTWERCFGRSRPCTTRR